MVNWLDNVFFNWIFIRDIKIEVQKLILIIKHITLPQNTLTKVFFYA